MAEQQAVFVEQARGAVVARLQCFELTSDMGDVLLQSLPGSPGAPGECKCVLDLSRLTFLGSIGLNLLVACLKRVQRNNGALALAGLNGHCQGVLKAVGLDRIFDIYPDVPKALDALTSPPRQ